MHEFVGLTELYYAGSHGMDIIGPVRQSLSVSHNKQVLRLNVKVSTYDPIMYLFEFLNILKPLFKSSKLQGKKVNLFQPAAEFLPMINEVDIREIRLQIIFQYIPSLLECCILTDLCFGRL